MLGGFCENGKPSFLLSFKMLSMKQNRIASLYRNIDMENESVI